MVIEIDKARAIELLEQVVEIRGADYVYEPDAKGNCVYADQATNAPSCGVGYALNLAGVSVEALVKLDQLNTNTDVETLNASEVEYENQESYFERIAEVILDNEAEKVFSVFQYQQDNFAAYGVALDKAKGV